MKTCSAAAPAVREPGMERAGRDPDILMLARPPGRRQRKAAMSTLSGRRVLEPGGRHQAAHRRSRRARTALVRPARTARVQPARYGPQVGVSATGPGGAS